ncbi:MULTISPECIES: hypothetical protein [Nostocales]|jgi:hypothetical protein|uniref:hypothetical protein n=1 Tax=Nostocales TaxID=1161 RepID=UPI00232EA065|nr:MULTISPECIES: hypothetical protein [Aphanizomenonaceae]MDB9476795.1 hypothetical protein [Dolichospermum circinale CS-537/11]MDB9498568.1 hypothetical protein [Nodularia spumigena CS-336/02]
MEKDIQLSAAGDFAIINGDLSVGESQQQHITSMLISSPGDWKQWPLTGVALPSYLLSPINAQVVNAMRRRIQLNLEADAYQVTKVDFDGINPIIEANK